MLLFHCETNIPVVNNFDTIDIIKIYLSHDGENLIEKKFNYEYENSIIAIDDNDFGKFPTFKDVGTSYLNEKLENSNFLIVLNYYFAKNSLSKYDINVDNFNVIDITNSFKILNLFGERFEYNLNNIIDVSDIETKQDRNLRGFQMIDLYKYLKDNSNLSNEELLSLNYYYKSNIFSSESSKFANKNLNDIPYKSILSILSFDKLNLKLKDCTTNQFKFNLIRHLLEDNQNTKNYKLSDVTDKKEFDKCINEIFIEKNIFRIDKNKIDNLINLSNLYFIVNNNKVDIELTKNRFIDNINKIDDIDEISF